MANPAELPSSLLKGRAAVFSRGLARLPHLQQFLGASHIVIRPTSASGVDYVVGWGHKPTTKSARRFAELNGLPFIRLEDGFLRSTDPGRLQPPASLVIDPTGIYYDSRTPSRLEAILQEGVKEPALLERAAQVASRIVTSRLSKYNQAPAESAGVMRSLPESYVLVVDQIGGDTSVQLAAEGGTVFERMVNSAVSENPGLKVVIKAHPAARSTGAGALSAMRDGPLGTAEVIWLTQAVNPHSLLARAAKVYVATSQLGFEALLQKKPVVCFGSPFYAGWGLTDDRASISRRGVARTLQELVAAALLLYPRYVHPVSGERCEVEDILEHFELQAAAFRKNEGRIFCFGFWWWKRSHARPFLRAPGNELTFCWNRAHAERLGFDKTCRALTWGQRAGRDVQALCDDHAVSLERMEDGFIRSVGLGSDLTAPWSLVVDRRGIYYNPQQPSELEELLSEHVFSATEVGRAARLRQMLLSSGLSKYNSVAVHETPSTANNSQRRILVPGQVEGDASVLLGSPEVQTNRELLRRVRRSNPDAHITFKPHPDVEAGNRRGLVPDEEALTCCDAIVRDKRIADCLEVTDELHTMTSLVGFEALLRELKVVVYGQPFYSGWGLTEDTVAVPRRGRHLSLDELVAGTLLLYPRYVDPTSGYFCTAEQAVVRLIDERSRTKGEGARLLNLPLGRPILRAYNFVQGIVQEARRV